MDKLYYTPSGTTPMNGLLLAVLAGSLFAIVPAALYAYMAASTGIVLLTVVALIVFGVFTGWLATWVLRRARVRNLNLAMAAAFVISLSALYANWVVWVYTVLHMYGESAPWTALAFDPGYLWGAIEAINAEGTWDLDDRVIRGGELWFVWIAEAVLILGLSLNYARRLFNDTPFCEECGNWCMPERAFIQTTNCKVEMMKQRMEAGDFAFLESLGPRRSNDNFYFSFDLYTCPGCGTTNTLSADDVTMEYDNRRDRERAKPTRVIHNLLIGEQDVAHLRAIAGRMKGDLQQAG